MSKLIDVDKIDWQEGVFVNPTTKEPLPIIHKIATIEMLRDWQKEVKATPIDKIKKAREEISKKIGEPVCGEYIKQGHDWGLKEALIILDKLIAESEE